MSLLKNQPLLFLVRIFLGGMFIYAAAPKILDPFDFAVAVYNYKLLPGFAVGLVAAGLPFLELLAGIFLVLGVRVRASALAITGMLGFFTLAMLVNTLRGINVDCGCFTTDRAIGWWAVGEDLTFTLMGLWYLLCADDFLGLESLVKKNEAPGGA